MLLNQYTKMSEFMEMLDWDLDGSGMIITDGRLLARTAQDCFPELEWDMSFPYESEEDEDE